MEIYDSYAFFVRFYVDRFFLNALNVYATPNISYLTFASFAVTCTINSESVAAIRQDSNLSLIRMGRRNEDDRDREKAGGCRVPKVSCFCADLEAKVATF